MLTLPDVLTLGAALASLLVALRVMTRLRTLEERLDIHIRSAPPASAPSAVPSSSASAACEVRSEVPAGVTATRPSLPTDRAASSAMDDARRRETLRQLAARRARRLEPATTPLRSDPPASSASHVQSAPPARFNLEQFLSTRLLVWIAAAAVALAGIFFAKHSYERGLISAGLRLAIAGGFGVGLLIAATFLRRRIANIAQALAASGVAVLFGAVLAGTWFEQMIPPLPAAGCMAVITALGVLLSLIHGPLVAVIGLLGGLITPVLIGPGQLPPGVGLVYLLLLEAGIVLITRRRGWWPLSAMMFVGSVIWSLVWLLLDAWTAPLPLLSLFVLVAAAGFIATTIGRPTVALPAPLVLAMRWVSGLFAVALITVMAPVGDFGLMPWMFVGVLSLGMLALARFDTRCLPLPGLMLAASVGLLWAWAELPLSTRPVDADIAAVTLAFGLIFGGGALLCLWRSTHAPLWCGLSLAGVLAQLISAQQLMKVQPPAAFGGMALVLALGYSLLAGVLIRRRADRPQAESALTVLAVGIAALVAIAIHLELPDRWIGIVWSLEAALLVPIHRRVRIRGGAAIIAAVALLGVMWLAAAPGPRVLQPVGPVVLNFMTAAYGLPLLAFAAAAVLLRHGQAGDEDRLLAAVLELLAAALGLLCVTLNVRYGFHGRLDAFSRIGMLEAATYCIAALVCVHVLLGIQRLFNRRALGLMAIAMLALAVAALIAWPMLARNPAFIAASVGEALVFNWLLYVYGLPSLLLAGVVPALRLTTLEPLHDASVDLAKLRPWVAAASLLLLLALITLQVRQGFQGSLLNIGHPSEAELYAYSAAWTVFGLLLLIGGLLRRSAALRWASLAVLMLTAGKVFLYDMRELEDLYRVFAFLGLGAVLLALAYLYQRFVFRVAAGQSTS